MTLNNLQFYNNKEISPKKCEITQNKSEIIPDSTCIY